MLTSSMPGADSAWLAPRVYLERLAGQLRRGGAADDGATASEPGDAHGVRPAAASLARSSGLSFMPAEQSL